MRHVFGGALEEDVAQAARQPRLLPRVPALAPLQGVIRATALYYGRRVRAWRHGAG